jgi:hypothetical protein
MYRVLGKINNTAHYINSQISYAAHTYWGYANELFCNEIPEESAVCIADIYRPQRGRF